MGMGDASILYASRWNQTNDEIMRSEWACTDIYTLFAAEGYWDWQYGYGWIPVYGHLQNHYGAETTQDVMIAEADHCRQYHYFTAVFHFGHGPSDYWGNSRHQGVYPDAPQQQQPPPEPIWDSEIYAYTGDAHRFEFIWACGTANKIGGFDDWWHASGLPFAWTHRGNGSLSENGYTDPWSSSGSYCFIGFENYSKPLSEWINGQNNYKHWLVFFYYYALAPYTVRQALDSASVAVGKEGFWDMPFYNYYDHWEPGPSPPAGNYRSRIRVYGDGYMALPAWWW